MGFEEVMKDINSFVTLDSKDRAIYTKDFEAIKNYIYSEMKKKDEAFAKIISSPRLGGSYADNLKVFKPDEFDLVIQLELPDQRLIDIEYGPAGFVKLNINGLLKKIERERHNDELCRQLRVLKDGNGYLVQANFHHWMQSIVTKVVNAIPDGVLDVQNMKYYIRHSIQGPAQTLHVKVESREFSIDFVPALRFPTSSWLVKRQCPEQDQTEHWIAVPKPLKKSKSTNDLNNLHWITSFVDQERCLIKGKNFLKPCIRMIKQIRDRHNITNLVSYYIKTVFLWIVVEKEEQKENDPNFWNNGLGNTFLYGYAKLLEYVESGNLPFFWDREYNMLHKFSAAQKSDIYNQLKSRYNDILKYKDDNPEKLYEIFLTKEQQASLKARNAQVKNGELHSTRSEKKQLESTESKESTVNVIDQPNLPGEQQPSSVEKQKLSATTREKQSAPAKQEEGKSSCLIS